MRNHRARTLKNQFQRPRHQSRQPSLALSLDSTREPRQGAAAVELALIMPILLTLTLGLCELGQALRVEAVLSEAARIACETGCRPGCSNTDVVTDADSVLTANHYPANYAAITILVNGTPGEVAAAKANDKITVQVSLPVSKVIYTNTFTYLVSSSTLSQTLSMLKQ